MVTHPIKKFGSNFIEASNLILNRVDNCLWALLVKAVSKDQSDRIHDKCLAFEAGYPVQ